MDGGDWILRRTADVSSGEYQYTYGILSALRNEGTTLDDYKADGFSYAEKDVIWNGWVKLLAKEFGHKFIKQIGAIADTLIETYDNIDASLREFKYKGHTVTYNDLAKAITEGNYTGVSLQIMARQKIAETLYKEFSEQGKDAEPIESLSRRYFNFIDAISPQLEAMRALDAENSALATLDSGLTALKSEMKEKCIGGLATKVRSVARIRDESKIEAIDELFTGIYHAFGDEDDRVKAARTAILASPKARQTLLGFVVHFCDSTDDCAARSLKALYPSHTASTVDEIKAFATQQKEQPVVNSPRK